MSVRLDLRIDPLARDELLDARAYYEDKASGLGKAFEREVERGLWQIAAAPLSCPVVRGALRRRPLFRFPHSILYRVTENQVQVIAVVHQRRGPRYLAARLRGR